MNWAQLKKNIGMRVQIEPIACRLDAQGHELPHENDDWIVESISETDVLSLRNIRTGHIAQLGKDHIYDFRSNPARSTDGITHGFLVLKMQIFLQSAKLWLRPNAKPGERVSPPAMSRRRPKATPALAPQRLAIRERSAAEILGHLKGKLSYQFRESVEELYIGRWTPEPGWQATVHDLPSKLSGSLWYCSFREVGSDTLVFASTVQDVSTLRPGDSVTLSGRIRDVRQHGTISLEDAIVGGDNVPSP